VASEKEEEAGKTYLSPPEESRRSEIYRNWRRLIDNRQLNR